MTVTPDEQPENPLHPDQPADPEAEPADPPVEGEPEEETEHIDGEDAEQQEEAPSEPSSLAITEEQEKKLTAEVKRHTGRVSDILGDSATELLTCPVCNPDLQGFLWEGDIVNADDPIRAAVRDALAPAPSVTYKQDPGTQMCDACDGEGQTQTGSRNPQYRLKVCGNCNGFGYYPPPGLTGNGAFTAAEAQQLVAVAAGDVPIEDADSWGHPRLLSDGRENPNYGKMPQYINPNYP